MERREQEVLDKIREKTADVEVPENLRPDQICQKLEERETKDTGKKRSQMWKIGLAAAACVALIAGFAARRFPRMEQTTTSRSISDAGDTDEASGSSKTIACAESYEQVYGYIKEYLDESSAYYSGGAVTEEESIAQIADDSADTGSAQWNAVPLMETQKTTDEALPAAEARAETGDYSQTNVRQEGVDEGDIVKTDGRYLYVLEDNGKEIAVIDTRDQKMEEVAVVEVKNDEDSCYIHEFYVIPDSKKMAVICSRGTSEDLMNSYPGYPDSGMQASTMAVTYDIQDPQNPAEEGRVSQSGNYRSSRMSEGHLYLFTEWSLYMYTNSGMEPREYIPLINGEMMKPGDIYLPPARKAYMYEVITSVDLKKPDKTKDSKAIFSEGGQVYVSNSNIYFYETVWGEYTGGCTTTLRKVAYKDGKLEAKAQGSFDGYLNDSFSIDEYKGNLRVVTTDDDSNAVYILNEELEEIGAIEKLAKDERVYSARFMGDIGYFVTFRETDPLFSVDLSDPENPKIIGELKIPGFSDYLHFYGENQLIGIGMNVDEETLVTDGVKLTMFDISDRADVKEADTYVLKNVYNTDVSYDYKAALIDPKQNIIGFPGDTEGGQKYYLFEYDKDDGFICNMEEEINGNAMRNARGLYIEDTLYIVKGNIIEAYSLKDYKKVGDLIL